MAADANLIKGAYAAAGSGQADLAAVKGMSKIADSIAEPLAKELNERGWKAEICKGLPAALEVIDNYFNEKD